jgi:hypothetical protein
VRGDVYGAFGDWTPINLFLQWINENNPQRQVTAVAGDFNWSNPAAWIDAFPDPARPGGAAPDNTRGSVDMAANEAARYYNVTLLDPGTITLDMNPQIDTLSIEGAHHRFAVHARGAAAYHTLRRYSDDGRRHAGYVRVLHERRPVDG